MDLNTWLHSVSTVFQVANMELAVVKLTLLGLALGTHGWGHCACLPDSSGPVCGSDFKTYESECWMQCAGAKLLWKGTCEDPDDIPDQSDKVHVQPVYDLEPPTPIIHLLNTDEDDLQRTAPSIEDLQEPTFRRINPPPVNPQAPKVHKIIPPLFPKNPKVRPTYKLVITPGGYAVRPKNPFKGTNRPSKGKSTKRPSHRENRVTSRIKGALAPYVLGSRPRLGPGTPISRTGSKPVANPFELRNIPEVNTSLFTLLSLPIPKL